MPPKTRGRIEGGNSDVAPFLVKMRNLVQEAPAPMTFTACCEGCQDMFTVWGKMKNKRVYVEWQSRLRLGNRRNGSGGDLVLVPDEGLYHYCGGRLALYPDYLGAK